MPDWAVVLVAALSGALAGAVLQLALAYVQRRRSGEEAPMERERQLRWMLEALTVQGRVLASGSSLVALSRRDDFPAPAAKELQEQLWQFPQAPPWRPEGIDDIELQLHVRDYADTMDRLHNLLSSERIDEEERLKLVARLGSLQARMTRRMAELRWPDVSD